MRRWIPAIAVTAPGAVVLGLSLAHGQGLELLWLPAVLLACAWPRDTSRRRCGSACSEPMRGRRS